MRNRGRGEFCGPPTGSKYRLGSPAVLKPSRVPSLPRHPSPQQLGPKRLINTPAMNPDDSPAGRKLVRLSLACNQCRKRKVRCDAKQPKCRNCSLRGEECETLDLRRPGKGPGVRQRARRSKGSLCSLPAEGSPGGFCGHMSTTAQVPALGQQMNPGSGRSKGGRGTHHSPSGLSSTSETRRDHALDSGEEISWVSRGYREITAAQPVAEGQSEGHTVSVVSPDVLVNTDETTYRFKVRP